MTLKPQDPAALYQTIEEAAAAGSLMSWKELLLTAAAAKLLGLSERSTRRYAQQGRIVGAWKPKGWQDWVYTPPLLLLPPERPPGWPRRVKAAE